MPTILLQLVLSVVRILTIWYSAWASLMLLWMRCEKESHCSVARACQNRAYIPPFYFVQYDLELWKKEPTIFFLFLSKHSEFSSIFFFSFSFWIPKSIGQIYCCYLLLLIKVSFLQLLPKTGGTSQKCSPPFYFT